MKVLAAILAAIAVAFPGAATAQSYGGASSSDLLGYRSSSAHYRSRSIAPAIRARQALPPPPRKPTNSTAPAKRVQSTSFTPVGPPITPARLAAAVPRNTAAKAYFDDLLSAYKDLLKRRGVAPNDVSRAATFLVANSYTVLHDGKPLDDARFEGLRLHLRELLGSDPDFQRLDNRARQALYERYAILGMHLLTAQSYFSRNPNAREQAVTRDLAREQMEDVFGLPASRLLFKADGVHLAKASN